MYHFKFYIKFEIFYIFKRRLFEKIRKEEYKFNKIIYHFKGNFIQNSKLFIFLKEGYLKNYETKNNM